MKKVCAILAAASAAFSAQAALAAPLSGPYFGVQVGHDAFEVKAKGANIGGDTVTADGLSGNGGSGAIFAGYDLALGTAGFVGVEAGFDYSGAAVSLAATSGGSTLSASIKARETYGIAARLGLNVASGTGLYAKLGYANTRFKTSAALTGSGSFFDSRAKGAFIYGGGIETGLADKLSIRGEFTVSDYGSAGLNDELGTNGIKVGNSKTTVGIAYRF